MGRLQPTVVIGLGGTGKKILLALKKMIIENSPNGMRDYPLLKLLSIDSDEEAEKITSEIRSVQKDITLDEYTEVKRIGSDGLNYTLDLDPYPEIDEWYPKSRNYLLNPTSLKEGCNQQKTVGRFVFAWNADSLYKTLYPLIGSTIDVDKSITNNIGVNDLKSFTNVFICGSLCGGTGAGTFLDVANLVRFIAKETGRQVFNYGIMALASIFGATQINDNCKSNTYASLIELDHFQNVINYSKEKRRFFPAYRNIGIKPNSKTKWNYEISSNVPSFDYTYLYDNTNENTVSFSSPKQFAEMAAKFIYLLTGSDVATEWKRVSNNMWSLLGKDEELDKPIRYASSGNSSIIYPRRKIIQLCSYKLACKYFDIILDNKYKDFEINNLVDTFLEDSNENNKITNPNLLEEQFSMFTDPDSEDIVSDNKIDFINVYLNKAKNIIEKNLKENNLIKYKKSEFFSELVKWEENQEKIFRNNFKNEIENYPKKYKELFISTIDNKISNMLNLQLVKDVKNETFIRGSISRTISFLQNIKNRYENKNSELFNNENNNKEEIEVAKQEYEKNKFELKNMLNATFSNRKNIEKKLNETLSKYKEFMEKRKNNLVSQLIRQYFSGILEDNTKTDGIIKILDNKILNLENAIPKLQKCKRIATDYIDNNSSEKRTGFNIEIFNFKKDVEELYNKRLSDPEKGEDNILKSLSNYLQLEENFNKDYSRLGNSLGDNRILEIILLNTETYFQNDVTEINFTERFFEDTNTVKALSKGAYLSTAGVYIRLDANVMTGSARLAPEGKIYYVISIPNEGVYQLYCKNQTRSEAGRPFICPFEPGGEKEHEDKKCPLYEKNTCLKKLLLQNLTTDIEIILSDNQSEINVFIVKAGFPLRAITSVMGPYREDYRIKIEKQKKDNINKIIKEEYIHMFGNIPFADLSEKEDDLDELKKVFRKQLLILYIGNLVEIDNHCVRYFSVEDRRKQNKSPTVELGKTFDKALELSDSLTNDDKLLRDEIKSISEELCSEKYFKDPNKKPIYIRTIKDKYLNIFKHEYGFTDEDAIIFETLSNDYFDIDCKPPADPYPLLREV